MFLLETTQRLPVHLSTYSNDWTQKRVKKQAASNLTFENNDGSDTHKHVEWERTHSTGQPAPPGAQALPWRPWGSSGPQAGSGRGGRQCEQEHGAAAARTWPGPASSKRPRQAPQLRKPRARRPRVTSEDHLLLPVSALKPSFSESRHRGGGDGPSGSV